MITRVDHVEINAKDVGSSVAFYRDVLGFEVTRWVRAERGGHTVEVACLAMGDFMIEVLPAGDAAVDQRSVGVRMLALRVDDMSATLEELRGKGVELAGEPSLSPLTFDGIRAEVLDPDGVRIELREWQRDDHYRGTAWHPAEGVVQLV